MTLIHRVCLTAVLIGCCFAAIALAQGPATPATEILITVGGEVEHPLKLTRADLDKFPRQTVQAKDHDGKDYKYEGVALGDILQKAGVKFGAQLRGKALATYVLAEATDGYQAVYALPEFDPPSADRVIILADRRDGSPLPAAAAPLQVIVPGDKTHARWVRQIKSLTIVRAPSNSKS